MRTLGPLILSLILGASAQAAEPMEWVRPSDDGKTFVGADSGRRVQLWGVNYDHDGTGRLIEDYWHDQWATVVEDFGEIKALGANCVRIHLQLGRFMEAADQPDAGSLAQLARLIALADQQQLYLIVTGLGCYHAADVPPWYDKLSRQERWDVQARFWQSVAKVCRESAAVFAYDLMNEPILPGEKKAETDWLAGDFNGKHFVQRIALDLDGQSRTELARAWVLKLTDAIRREDRRHMITLGAIPWAHHFPGAKPLFYSAEVSGPLDFVSVHFYPRAGKVDAALTALDAYEVGKPLVVEEVFPLHCSGEEALEFIDRSQSHADGWVSFYWGQTVDECEAKGDLPGAITAAWLRMFKSHAAPAPSAGQAPAGKD